VPQRRRILRGFGGGGHGLGTSDFVGEDDGVGNFAEGWGEVGARAKSVGSLTRPRWQCAANRIYAIDSTEKSTVIAGGGTPRHASSPNSLILVKVSAEPTYVLCDG
jgi:hypothetical protein